MKELNSIIQNLSGVIALRGRTGRTIRSICYDSRQVEEGDLFVAVNGRDDQALRFVEDALERGAAAVILDDPERMPEKGNGATFLLVHDARIAMAEAAAELQGRPAESLRLYGVTGTNGKTTVAYLLRDMLQESGQQTGLIGTLGATIGETEQTGYTTPESPQLQEILRRMVDGGITEVVMEVSSHALQLDRVHGLRFNGAIYTNISHDHLDFHTTFQDYSDAKKRLFDRLDADATAVVNIDDLQGATMVRDSDAGIIRYGRGSDADLRIDNTELSATGSAWVVTWSDRFGGGSDRFESPLVGGFNVMNVTAACAMGVAAGISREDLPALVSRLRPVPGRMESLRLQNGASAIVDFAHSPDALENLLEAARGFLKPGGAIHLVFGCGGDRDRAKRPVMGEVAARLADRLYITSDNPRGEDPAAIIAEIEAGTGVNQEEKQERIIDRATAIAKAVSAAASDDIVIVAGKGDERTQIIGEQRLPFDDRDVIKDADRRPVGHDSTQSDSRA